MTINISFSSTIGECTEFIPAPYNHRVASFPEYQMVEERKVDSMKETVSVVIYPTKWATYENGQQGKVHYGCNMWEGCYNKACYLSMKVREEPSLEKDCE